MAAFSDIGWFGITAVAIGAALGAWARLALGLALNELVPGLPLGTLTANVAGGLLIGMCVAWFLRMPGLDPVWRLFCVTGFLGGLTTFSTFSAESLQLIQAGRLSMALLHSGVHVLGSLAAAALGFRLVR